MRLPSISEIFKSEHLMLLPLLGLAFYVAFIPHLNYPYPLHVDEWIQLSRSRLLMEAGGLDFPGSFLLEAGFHVFWGVFQNISGIPWMDIFRYFPSVIFMLTVLSVYIMAQREGFGLEAAFFTCLIPTTVGILGPAFLVPVSMGLLFTPLIIFLALNFSTIWSYPLIFIFSAFLLAMHPPSAIFPIIVLAPYILLNMRGNFKHHLGVTLALLLPFLVIFPWIAEMLLPTARDLLTPQPPTSFVQLPRMLQVYGYLPILFSLLGTFLLVMKGSQKSDGLVLGLLALLLMLLTFFTFHYGVPIIYERGLTYLMLMLSIVAGAGLAAVKNLRLPAWFSTRLKAPFLAQPFIVQNTGRFLSLVIVGIMLATYLPERLDTLYYHMIDREDYQAFVWIDENIGADYDTAIVDPWKATAFIAITNKKAFTRIHNYPTGKDNKAYDFLRKGSTETTFLRQNDISIVYTRVFDTKERKNAEYASDNPNLVEVARNVYLLKEIQK